MLINFAGKIIITKKILYPARTCRRRDKRAAMSIKRDECEADQLATKTSGADQAESADVESSWRVQVIEWSNMLLVMM